jgi:hypothetical protein
MPKISYKYDSETRQLLDELKDFFGVESHRAVISRSLGLARIAKSKATKRKTIIFAASKDDPNPETILCG